jgi:hypothetical protein
MGRKKLSGICHICGKHGQLSFEHVPPEAAFNNRPIMVVPFDEAIKLGPRDVAKGRIQQQGAGGYTLCGKCNNDTGSWYGARFVDWCYAGMEMLIKTDGHPGLICMRRGYPLEIIKQIITMFFSINPPEFAQANPDLVRFILNKRDRGLSPRFRFFVYYNLGNKYRTVGISTQGDITTGRVIMMSEVGYVPFGYVMTIGSEPPDPRLFEITGFSRGYFGRYEELKVRPKILPVHLLYPGDYRTQRQIQEDYVRNAGKLWSPSGGVLE